MKGNYEYRYRTQAIKKTPLVQKGNAGTISTNSQSTASKDVTFLYEYSATPIVLVGFQTASTAAAFGKCSVEVTARSKTGFSFRVFNNDSSKREPNVVWIAIGSRSK